MSFVSSCPDCCDEKRGLGGQQVVVGVVSDLGATGGIKSVGLETIGH